MAENKVVNGRNTQLQSGKYDPTTGFYIQDASGRAVAVRDMQGKLLSQDEEAAAIERGDQVNTTWEQIAQKQAEAAPSPAPAAAPPVAPPTAPAAAVAASAAAPAALQQLASPQKRDGGAGLQEGGLTPLDTGLGARMLPASSRALAALAQRRGGRVY